MTEYIRIDYVVKPEVALDELKGAIAEFVAGIHAHHPDTATPRFNTRPIPCGLFTLARSWRRSFRISRSNRSFSASLGF